MGKQADFYNENAKTFFDSTVQLNISHLYKPFLARVPAGGRILDAGCGSGRDAKRFIELGYKVEAFDASPDLAQLATAHLGQPVACMVFDQMNYDNEFDGVWACASLLHVPKTDLPDTLRRIARSLKVGGACYVSFKYGGFEGQRNGRYFHDLDERGLAEALRGLPFKIAEEWKTTDARLERASETWLNAVLLNV